MQTVNKTIYECFTQKPYRLHTNLSHKTDVAII